MVSVATLGESPALFGGAASSTVARLLQEACGAHAGPRRTEALLWTARALDASCLAVYFALYKFYFHQGRLGDAEHVARLALTESARQAGFEADWRRVAPDSCDWSDSFGPQHFYLFSLKALAFIVLRQQRAGESGEILAKLEVLDPADSVGASVVRELAGAMED